MKTFTFTFTGRRAGAIGSFSRFTVTVSGENQEAALLRLYETHEHIRLHSVTEIADKEKELASVRAALAALKKHSF